MDSDEEEWLKPVENDAKTVQTCSGRPCLSSCVHDRVILHIDIDCFYAQVEMLRNPALRTKPLGIQQKYIIVTCNYVAREQGLTKLMTVKAAREMCPDMVLVNGEDLTNYRNMSYKISGYLQQYCPLVERLGFDENFLDITQLVKDRIQNNSSSNPLAVAGHVYGDGEYKTGSVCGCEQQLVVGSHIAAEIREGLFKELGITSCGGIAHNKLLSKLVAGTHKPNQQTTLFPRDVGTLMAQLNSVRCIPGIGSSTAKRLRELSVVTTSDLQNADVSLLKEEFGVSMAETMRKLCVGEDDSPVVAFGLPQTLSDEDSFKKCGSFTEAKAKISQLIKSLLTRLLEDGRKPHTIRVSIRRMTEVNRYGNRESRQCNIPQSVFVGFSSGNISTAQKQLEDLGNSLFCKMVNIKQPFHLTLINIAFTNLKQKSACDISNFLSPKEKHNSGNGEDTTNMCSQGSVESFKSTAQNQNSSNSFNDTSLDTSVQMHSLLSLADTCIEPVYSSQGRPLSSVNADTVSVQEQSKRKSTEGRKSGLQRWLSANQGKTSTAGSCGSEPRLPDLIAGVQEENSASGMPIQGDGKLQSNMDDDCRKSSFFQRKMKRILDETPAKSVASKRVKPDDSKSALCHLADTDEFLKDEPYKVANENLDNLHTSVDPSELEEPPPEVQQRRVDAKITVTGKNADFSVRDTPDSLKQKGPEIKKIESLFRDTLKENENKDASKAGVTSKNKELDKHKTINLVRMEQKECSDNFIDLSCKSKPEVTGRDKSIVVEDFDLPPNIDHSVFIALPSDIQSEIISEWKQKCHRDSKVSKPPQTKKVKIERRGNYIKNPKPSSSNDITSYFSKKCD